MPLRPPPYAWTVGSIAPDQLVAAVRQVAESLGFDVSARASDEGGIDIVVEGSVSALDQAAEELGSDRETIDPPEDEKTYRFVVRFVPSDEEDTRARMVVPPYDDNWAAWSVIGPLADLVAEAIQAREITGDLPLWVQAELERSEPTLPSSLPVLFLRSPTIFPGFVGAIPFNRPSSIAAIQKLLADKQLRVALVSQGNPASEQPPRSFEEVDPIALDARILEAVEDEGGFTLVTKGIARVKVNGLDLSGSLPVATLESIATVERSGGGFEQLRDFVNEDPMVRDHAGASLLARADELHPGMLADLVARTLGDRDLCRHTFLEVDDDARATMMEAVIAGLGDDADDHDDDNDNVWEKASAIIGPWEDRDAAEEALGDALASAGFEALEERVQGCSIARLYQIEQTIWISVDPDVVASLAGMLTEARIFGVEEEYGESGNRAVGVELWRLEVDEEGTVVKAESIRSEPEDRNALDAALDWEIRLAGQSISAPPGEVKTWLVFYSE